VLNVEDHNGQTPVGELDIWLVEIEEGLTGADGS
jgi:hypothetical protein